MARPLKEGLFYFPLSVRVFEDEKIEAIAGEFGIKGELFVIKLLCAIYEKGYFIVWDDLTKSKLLKRIPGASKDLLDQIVNRLVTWGFFHESLFNSAKVLTSERIQANYFDAVKRRKSPKPTLYIINVDNNPEVTGVNVNINTQRKEKKRKEDKTKEKDKKNKPGAGEPASAPVADIIQEDVVIAIILNDKSEYLVTQQMVDEWSGLYPAVDIMQELRKMRGWCDANPQKRKTRRGVKTFINNWLSRTQDRGGNRTEVATGGTGNPFLDM